MALPKRIEKEPRQQEARKEQATPGEAFLKFKYRLIDAVNETLPEEEKITADIEATTLYAENGDFRLRTAAGLEERVVFPSRAKNCLK